MTTAKASMPSINGRDFRKGEEVEIVTYYDETMLIRSIATPRVVTYAELTDLATTVN